MSVATLTLQIGPANVPVALLLIAAGFVVAQLVSRVLWREHREEVVAVNDWATTAILIGFLAWKITPLVTRFSIIAEAPLRLLYYPGGNVGIVFAVIAASAYAVIAARRSKLDLSWLRVAVQSALLAGAPLVLVGAALLIPVDAPVERGVETLAYLDTPEPARLGDLPESLGAVDRPLVVVYWATWCGPCTAQMPEVERAWSELRDEALLFGVDLFYTEPSLAAVSQYVSDNQLSFPIVLDRSGELADRHEVVSTPTTLIFAADGSLVARRTGSANADWIVGRVLPHVE
jgi:thiol-disulfide isomerase/thioredoxin